jgi:hypothetical protein
MIEEGGSKIENGFHRIWIPYPLSSILYLQRFLALLFGDQREGQLAQRIEALIHSFRV